MNELPKPDEPAMIAARDRVARWEKRQEHRSEGGTTLTLAELDSLIKKTQETLDATESVSDKLALQCQLDDMKRELVWRTFLGEQETLWPKNLLERPAPN